MILVVMNNLDESGNSNAVYLASEPFISNATDTPAHTPFDEYILDGGALTRRITEAFYGYSTTGLGAINLSLNDELIAIKNNGNIKGQDIDIYLGEPSQAFADFTLIAKTQGNELKRTSDSEISLTFKDNAERLNQSITSTGEPLTYGTVFNIEPVLEDASTLVYRVHDGAIEDITDVRDGGLSVSFTKDLTNGTFTLSTAAQGRITCDVKGAKVSGTHLTSAKQIIPDLASRIGETISESDINIDEFELGIFINDEQTLSSVLDKVALSVMGYWRYDRFGGFEFNLLPTDTATASAEIWDDDINRGTWNEIRTIEPASKVECGYALNYTVQEDGLFGAVSTSNRELYAKQQQYAATENSLPQYPNATSISFSTLLVHEADAQTVSDRRAAFRSIRHKVYSCEVFSAAFNFNVGQIIALVDTPEFSANNVIVLGLIDEPLSNLTQVEFLI